MRGSVEHVIEIRGGRRTHWKRWVFLCVVVAAAVFAVRRMPQPVREKLRGRAAVEFAGGFQGGLADWTGQPGWQQFWSRDAGGSMRAGSLALYRPSLRLKDYRLEFQAALDEGSIAWVYRASDLFNYYIGRLTVVRPGPPAALVFERSAVVCGREQPRVQTSVRTLIDTRQRQTVEMEINRNVFRLSLNGDPVDFWFDAAHASGGAGFIGDSRRRTGVYSFQIRSHGDTVGRVCAWLVEAGA